MSERSTNFALLCDLLEVIPKHLSVAVGADTTLVSRWRTGNRKLMPGRHWVNRIAEYMLVQDAQSGAGVCEKLLKAYFPGQPMQSLPERARLLANFLTMGGQSQPEFLKRRFELLNPLFPGHVRMPGSYGGSSGKPTFGVAGLQSTIVEFLDIAARTERPVTLMFACLAGLDMLIGDEAFALRVLDRLSALFERGYRLEVCLGTGLKPVSVSRFSRRWIWMHMRGYIKSYCCDGERRAVASGERMMAAIPGRAAFSVIDRGGAATGPYASQVVLAEQPGAILEHIRQMMARSHPLIRTDFFRNPEGYLHGVEIMPDQPAGRISMMPHFGILPHSEYPLLFGLSESQAEHIRREFSPLLVTPDQYEPTTPVRYIFCQDEIDEQLMKNRHGVPIMSEMLDKQVFMTTRMLARQLKALRDLLFNCRNLEVAFVPRFMMDQFAFQLHAWGASAAIGVMPMSEANVCVDPHACLALVAQIETIWNQLPFLLRNRAESAKKLNMWLEKARRYGALDET